MCRVGWTVMIILYAVDNTLMITKTYFYFRTATFFGLTNVACTLTKAVKCAKEIFLMQIYSSTSAEIRI